MMQVAWGDRWVSGPHVGFGGSSVAPAQAGSLHSQQLPPSPRCLGAGGCSHGLGSDKKYEPIACSTGMNRRHAKTAGK